MERKCLYNSTNFDPYLPIFIKIVKSDFLFVKRRVVEVESEFNQPGTSCVVVSVTQQVV